MVYASQFLLLPRLPVHLPTSINFALLVFFFESFMGTCPQINGVWIVYHDPRGIISFVDTDLFRSQLKPSVAKEGPHRSGCTFNFFFSKIPTLFWAYFCHQLVSVPSSWTVTRLHIKMTAAGRPKTYEGNHSPALGTIDWARWKPLDFLPKSSKSKWDES